MAPKWAKEPHDIRINAGEDLEIECKADGEPRPKIIWITSEGIKFEICFTVNLIICIIRN